VELLAYAGALVALVGVFVLVYASGAALGGLGALTAGLGGAALIAANVFTRARSRPAFRAAGACAALGAGALGVGVGQILVAAGLLVDTITHHDYYGFVYTTTDASGAVLAGACTSMAIAMAASRYLPAHVLALTVVAAVYTAAGALIAASHPPATGSRAWVATVIVLASLGLAGFGETLRRTQPRVHGFYGFVAVIGATVPLYILGGRENLYLDILGACIAIAGLAGGLQLPRPGIAYGGVIAVFGLVFDIGARNFSSATSLGAFLTLVGAGGIVALVAINHALRAPQPPGAPQPPARG